METSNDDQLPPPEKADFTPQDAFAEKSSELSTRETSASRHDSKADKDGMGNGANYRSPSADDEGGISSFHHMSDDEKEPRHVDGEVFQGFESPELEHSSSPGPKQKNKVNVPGETAGSRLRKMQKFSLYETQARYYLVGGDTADDQYRMLKIDRTSPPGQLSIVEDEIVYTKKEINHLLHELDHGNRAAGGMKLRGNSWGLLGFIRFTDAYYMVQITKRQQVAMVGGYFIFQVDGTDLIPLTTAASSRFQNSKHNEEIRYLSILNNLDLHRSFYFSYSYNVTRSLQHNIIKGRELYMQGVRSVDQHDYNDMFVWNHYLLGPAIQNMKNPYDWCLPVIHGFIDQSSVNCFGRNIYIALIARRSRFFAGARFLKRGANDLGYVANDVETEQIVADMITTSFDGPGHFALQNPNYTSFVQHRGSIPLYWTQDNSGVSPKPAIDLNIIDPFYSSAALHFDNLFERYGAPVIVLNLVKARERTPREGKLLVEYQNAINYLNQSLPEAKKILYRAYDMARASKTRGQDVIGTLENIAKELLRITSFFHNGRIGLDETNTQNGVIRSNCIDCLDRTNAAQFVVGKVALGLQLQALGLIAEDSINYDSDASNLFAHMFNDHGDTIASQYGGSHLVNTTDSYRKIQNWQSHSRDMLESFKRYYHNSFLDSQRQEAYNLFLGNYKYAQGELMLWELPNDYYLHHAIPSSWSEKHRRDYIQWFTPEFLEPRVLPPVPDPHNQQRLISTDASARDWWQDYYRPQILSFEKSFAFRINSTAKYLPKHDHKVNTSPFCVRKQPYEVEHPTKKHGKDVAVTDANSREVISPLSATLAPRNPAKRISSLQAWLHPKPEGGGEKIPLKKEATPPSVGSDAAFKPSDKALRNQWTLRQFHANSLHPNVTDAEAAEYERYMSHPLRLSLVVSTEVPAGANLDFSEYLESAGDVDNNGPTSADLVDFENWLEQKEDPLTVTADDGEKKRYQAYRKWLRGKSLFKQSKVDPEFLPGP